MVSRQPGMITSGSLVALHTKIVWSLFQL